MKESSGSEKLLADSIILAPPTSPTGGPTSRASSDGDELRDMFSIMGPDNLYLSTSPAFMFLTFLQVVVQTMTVVSDKLSRNLSSVDNVSRLARSYGQT